MSSTPTEPKKEKTDKKEPSDKKSSHKTIDSKKSRRGSQHNSLTHKTDKEKVSTIFFCALLTRSLSWLLLRAFLADVSLHVHETEVLSVFVLLACVLRRFCFELPFLSVSLCLHAGSCG